jgi:DNA recombination protein RmuC
MEVLYLILGLTLGAFTTWFVLNTIQKSKSSIGQEKILTLQSENETIRKQLSEKEAVILETNKKLSARETDLLHLNNRLLEQKAEVEKLQERFTIEFKNLANEILEDKSKRFTEQNKTNLDQLLKPLGEKIKDFEKRVEETYDKESKQRFSLAEEVKRLAELNQTVGQEARNLTKALKGEAKTQGNWGEVILESILEKSGLVKDRQYFVQKSYDSGDDRRLQPDVVIEYPGERCIIVDSKVSLNAYERFVSSLTPEEQELAAKEHLISVKRHIDELSAKGYHTLYELKSLDFVMLFMPIEPAYLLAIQNDPGLWNYAYEKRILLISPTNLIAALKMVESMWRQEYQNLNAEEIARQSGALYDKFESLVQDLIEIGKKLDSAKDYYKDSMNKLTEGKGNLVSRVENIKKLGAKTKKNLPQALVGRAEDNI